MSHFVMGVVCPKNTKEIKETVSDYLAKYCENEEVPEYAGPCYCLGLNARNKASRMMEEKLGSWDAAKKKFAADPEVKAWKKEEEKLLRKNSDNWSKKEEAMFDEVRALIDKRWKEGVYQPREDCEKAIFAELNDDSPDKNCDDCKGTGVDVTTCNPDGKWDWYEIGGRWSDWFKEMGCKTTNQGNITTIKEYLKVLKKDFDKNSTYGLVIKGEWLEKGTMGWFGMSTNEMSKKEYKKVFINALKSCDPEDKIVIVDCHT